jgi:NAD(P)-dependent dehydrogenase (short-subunit alcohol dehydrogenase family)
MPTAVITGASRGLGRALATDLARDGWRLVLDARTAADLDAVATTLAPDAEGIVALAGDVTDDAHRRELAAAAGDRLDLLVLNASTLGTSPLPPLAAYGLEALREVIETNAVAPLRLTQLALPALRAAGGRVLALSSDAAVGGYPGWGGYGASKAALDQLANVLGAEEPAIRVYAVDPGDMRTRMHAEAFPGEDISDRPEPETVVPALRRLAFGDLPSGRYLAAELSDPPPAGDALAGAPSADPPSSVADRLPVGDPPSSVADRPPADPVVAVGSVAGAGAGAPR